MSFAALNSLKLTFSNNPNTSPLCVTDNHHNIKNTLEEKIERRERIDDIKEELAMEAKFMIHVLFADVLFS